MDEHRGALRRGYELPGYRIESVLGPGSFGITYLAEDLRPGRPVAIKEYLPAQMAVRGHDGASVVSMHSEARESFAFGMLRFREEAQTLVTFEHPNIVAVERFFEDNGTAYMVMEYHRGESLADTIEVHGPIARDELAADMIPTCWMPSIGGWRSPPEDRPKSVRRRIKRFAHLAPPALVAEARAR